MPCLDSQLSAKSPLRPDSPAGLPWVVFGRDRDRPGSSQFIQKNVDLILAALPVGRRWSIHLSVYTPPVASGESDLDWLFVDLLSGPDVYALSLVSPREHARAGENTREDFRGEAWAVDSDNPFGAQVLAIDLPESWSLLCRLITALSVHRVTLSFGS